MILSANYYSMVKAQMERRNLLYGICTGQEINQGTYLLDGGISVSLCFSISANQYLILGERNAGLLEILIKTWHFLGKSCKKKAKELYLTYSSGSAPPLLTLPQTHYLHLRVLRCVHSFPCKTQTLLWNHDLSSR